MEKEVICLDTSVLIDFFRKTKKENSFLVQLRKRDKSFVVSVVTEFEVYCGSTNQQKQFWDTVFQQIRILSFEDNAKESALEIHKNLKQRNKLIEIPDIFIEATAKAHKLKLATLNIKHFERIEGLELITPTTL